VDFADVIRGRRMVRSFRTDPVDPAALGRILDAARRAPSAGYAQGVELLVLEGVEETERFWACTFTPEGRERFRWQGLFDAPVIVIPFAHAATYLARYAEPDKSTTGLGESADRWPVPFWLTDAAMAAENLLLAVVDEGLGALFFGIFSDVSDLRATFGVPDGFEPIGAIALGHPAPDEPSRSVSRGRRPADEVVHRGTW
jgi:nitroreductase